MVAAIYSVWALFLGIALLMLGNGLQGSLLGLRAGIEGFNSAVIGAVMAGYYAGFLIGSIVTPVLIARVGHIRVFAALASLASTSALLFVLFVHPGAWFAMRVLSGFCIAGLYVVSESWLNHNATNETRGQLLSVYMIVMFAFMGAGQFMLNLADPGGFVLFVLVSALISLSLVPVSLTTIPGPQLEKPKPVTVGELYRRSPLAVIGCLGLGAAQGAFFTMTAVYATQLGLSVAKVSLLLSVPFLGVVLLQYPIGLVSDRYDRRRVIVAVAVLSALVAVVCNFAADRSFAALAVLFAVFGGLSMPIYSIVIAHANDCLDEDQRLGASGKLVLVNGFGSMFGPVLAGSLLDRLGPSSFLYYMAAIYLLLAVFAIYRMTRSAPIDLDERIDFVLLSPRATAVAATTALAEEGWSDDEGKDTGAG